MGWIASAVFAELRNVFRSQRNCRKWLEIELDPFTVRIGRALPSVF